MVAGPVSAQCSHTIASHSLIGISTAWKEDHHTAGLGLGLSFRGEDMSKRRVPSRTLPRFLPVATSPHPAPSLYSLGFALQWANSTDQRPRGSPGRRQLIIRLSFGSLSSVFRETARTAQYCGQICGVQGRHEKKAGCLAARSHFLPVPRTPHPAFHPHPWKILQFHIPQITNTCYP